MESVREKVARLMRERIEIVPYDPAWPEMFEQEKARLRRVLPPGVIGRIEHFGSTAVPGLAAKPVIDMLVETPSLDLAKKLAVPVLEGLGYDYLWRPSFGDDVPPWYCWFIRRGPDGRRTHHIHMIEPDCEHWDRLLFRDALIADPALAREYERLKLDLARRFPGDRAAYTLGKTEFVARVMQRILPNPAQFDEK